MAEKGKAVEKAMETKGVVEVKKLEKNSKKSFVFSDLVQSQKFLNLATGNLEPVSVITKKIVFTDDCTVMEKLDILSYHVSPAEKQIEAFEKYIATSSYQESKAAALAKGEYLTPELKSTIVDVMRRQSKWADESAADCFKSWLELGYKADEGSPAKLGAMKILRLAKEIVASDDDFGF